MNDHDSVEGEQPETRKNLFEIMVRLVIFALFLTFLLYIVFF